MIRYIIRRLLWVIVLLFLVSFITFIIFYVFPTADPAQLRAGRQPNPQLVEQIRHNLEGRLGTTVEPVDVRSAAQLTDRINAAPSLLDTLAPLVGLLLRGREALV